MGGWFPITVLTLWIPAVLVLFASMPPRRAMLVALFGGWLFLPVAAVDIPGLTQFDKLSATTYAILLGAAVFDSRRFASLRFSWIDLPILALMLAPVLSSLSAGYGLYDGLSWAVRYLPVWGVPYLIGRAYFRTGDDLLALSRALIISALIYVPATLLEVWISPQLHRMVYGYFPGSFMDAHRLGGWRPFVFMQHGMMLGLFMCSAAIAAGCLQGARAFRDYLNIPAAAVSLTVAITALLTRSLGAIVLGVVAFGVALAVRSMRTAVWAWALILFPVCYISSRLLLGWRGDLLVEWTNKWAGSERADSLWTRMNSEYQLCQFVQSRLYFGAARFEFAGMTLEGSDKYVLADGLWIILLGRNGLFGLVSCYAMLLIPCAWYAASVPASRWMTRECVGVTASVLIVLMFAIDCLLNAMISPVYVVAAGAVASFMCCRSKLPLVRPGTGGPARNLGLYRA